MHLIPEVFLKWFATISEAWAVLGGHLGLLYPRVTDPDVMPHAQAYGIGVLVRLDADPAPAIRYVFDRSVSVEVPHQQAGKAATMLAYRVEPLAFILADPWRFTDQRAGTQCRASSTPVEWSASRRSAHSCRRARCEPLMS